MTPKGHFEINWPLKCLEGCRFNDCITVQREREAALLGANASTYVNITSSENSGKEGPD